MVPARRALVDLLFGLAGGIYRGSERYRRWRRERSLPPANREVMASAADNPVAALNGLKLETSEHPLLTILITSYGNLGHVAGCLRSIADHPPDTSYEVIVADDAPHVPAMARLAGVPGLRFLPNGSNLGYLRTVNGASRHARGQFLWLLNDDTLVTAGAGDALLDTLIRVPRCVAAGSRLLNTDGTVQEAGSIVWRDGTAANAGAGTDRLDATTRYMRDADYCSAASMMLRTADFAAAGGYDDRYAPAYYEDTDLAFRLRAQGGRVVLQPASDVVHIGGGSYGSAASRQLLEANRGKFVARWGAELAAHCKPGHHSFLSRDRAARLDAVLMLSAGGIDPAVLERLAAAGFSIKLWIDDRILAASLVEQLGAKGIETVSANIDEQLGRWLRQHRAALDFAVTVGGGSRSPDWQLVNRYATAELPPDREPGAVRVARFANADAVKQARLMAALAGGATALASQP